MADLLVLVEIANLVEQIKHCWWFNSGKHRVIFTSVQSAIMASSSKRKAPSPYQDDKFTEYRQAKKKAKASDSHAGLANVTKDTSGKTAQEKFNHHLPDLEKDRNQRLLDLKANGKFTATLPKYGVYIVDDDFHTEKMALVAGYLNCPSEGTLWERFYDNEGAKSILEGLYNHEKVSGSRPPLIRNPSRTTSSPHLYNLPCGESFAPRTNLPLISDISQADQPYGMDLKSKPQFKRDQCYQSLAKDFFGRDEVERADEPDPNPYGTKDIKRMHLCWLRAAVKLIATVPTSFPGAEEGASKPYIDGLLEAEDFSRFIVLYRKFYCAKVQGPKGSENVKRKSQKLPALPVFCLPGAALRNTAEQTAQNQRDFARFRQQSLDEMVRGFSFTDFEEQKGQASALDSLGNLRVTLHPTIPHLEGNQQEALLSDLGGQTTFLFRDRDRSNQMFFPPVQTAEEHSDAVDNHTKATEAKMSLRTAAERQAFKQAEFLRLQQLLNSCSATPPTWEAIEQQKILPVDVVELGEQVDELTQQNFQMHWRGLQVFPWQPQAAAFMLQNIRGPLRAAINCDDVGLCKTSSTLMAVVEESIRIQADRDRWTAQYEALLRPQRPLGQDGAPLPSNKARDMDIIARDPDLRRQVEALGQQPKHRPVLACVSLSALGTWIHDVGRFYQDAGRRRNIVLRHLFSHQDPELSPQQHASAGAAADMFRKVCQSLGEDDELTSRTIFLATHQGFQRRFLDPQRRGEGEPSGADAGDQPAHSTGQSGEGRDQTAEEEQHREKTESAGGAEEADEFDLDGDEGADGEQESSEEDFSDPTSAVADDTASLRIPSDTFSIVVIDEAHHIKNPKSLQTRALYKLTECRVILVTATPCINTIRDFGGFLRFMWKGVAERFEGKDIERPNQRSFVELRREFDQEHQGSLHSVPPERLQDFLSALDPENFRSLLGNRASPLDMELSEDVLPLLLRMTCLRRCKGDKMTIAGREISLGAAIPYFEVTFVELRQNIVEASRYHQVHTECLGTEGAEGDDADSTNPRHRRLQHATLHPALDSMSNRNVGKDAKEIRKLMNRGVDSFEVYYNWTTSTFDLNAPRTRKAMADYLVRSSVKLQALCDELVQVVVREDRKMLIFADWPLNLWVIELLLHVLQIAFRSIRAGVSPSDRLAAEHAYNYDPNLKVLLLSSRSGAESLNLQRGGWHTVVVDVVAINTLLQIIGRAFRVGQLHPQQIKVLTVDESHDQYLLHKYISNYIAQVAATAWLPVSDEALAAISEETMQRHPGGGPEAADYRQFLRQSLRQEYVAGLTQCIFGIRSKRTGEAWADLEDPKAKNMIPEERLFRLASGGDVAEEMLDQLKQRRNRADAGGEVASASPKTKPTYRLNPFASLPLSRPMFNEPSPDAELIDAMAEAAREMAASPALRIGGISAADCLRSVKTQAMSPSPHIEAAIERLAELRSQDEAELQQVAQPRKRPQRGKVRARGPVPRGRIGPGGEVRGTGDEQGDGSGLRKDPQPATAGKYTVIHRPFRPATDHAQTGPHAEEDMTASQHQDYERYQGKMAKFKKRESVGQFAENEFGVAVNGTRKVMDNQTAFLWVQREAREGEKFRPDWNKYADQIKVALAEIEGEE